MSKSYIDMDGLHFDDAEIAKKLDRMTISATLMEGMLSCPAKQLFNQMLLDEIQPPQPDSPLTRGIAFHRTMELYYGLDESKRGKTINTAILNAAMKKALLEQPEVKDDTNFQSWLVNAVKRYVLMPDDAINVGIAEFNDKWYNKKPGLEMPVSGFIGNAKRRSFGKIDRLTRGDLNDDNIVIIDDYKTGAKAKAFNEKDQYADFGYIRQQIMYALLLEQDDNNDFKVKSGRLIYPVADNQDKNKTGVVLTVDVLNEKYRNRTIHEVEKVSRMVNDSVESNTFSCNPSALCSWCPLANICPRAERRESPKFVEARQKQFKEDELKPVIEKN